MPRNSKAGPTQTSKAAKLSVAQLARIVLGVLLLANLVGVWFMLYPPGGSAEGLQEDLARKQTQLQQSKARIEASRLHAASVQKGRGAADEFLGQYFVTRRTVPTTLLTELGRIAQKAGIKDQPHNNYSADLIDGSETLGMITITTTFEGTYRNLLAFVREIDQSDNLFIIDSLSAAPQTNSNLLTIALKMEAFLREDQAPKEAPVAEVPVAAVSQGATR